MKILFHKITKFFYAIILLPFCYTSFLMLIYVLKNIEYSNSKVYPFFLGAGCYLVVHFLLYKPIKIYVIGHELMHALSAKLCGAQVRRIKVNKFSGTVDVSKVNTFIALSPYFVPLYSIVIGIIWLIVRYVFKLNVRIEIFMFLLGFSLMFHLVLTIFAVSVGQQDFKISGWLFSIVVIFIVNCIFLITLLLVLLPNKIGYMEAVKKFFNLNIEIYKVSFTKSQQIIKYIINTIQKCRIQKV